MSILKKTLMTGSILASAVAPVLAENTTETIEDSFRSESINLESTEIREVRPNDVTLDEVNVTTFEEIDFETVVQEDANLYVGETIVIQEGQKGALLNGVVESEPVNRIISVGTKVETPTVVEVQTEAATEAPVYQTVVVETHVPVEAQEIVIPEIAEEPTPVIEEIVETPTVVEEISEPVVEEVVTVDEVVPVAEETVEEPAYVDEATFVFEATEELDLSSYAHVGEPQRYDGEQPEFVEATDFVQAETVAEPVVEEIVTIEEVAPVAEEVPYVEPIVEIQAVEEPIYETTEFTTPEGEVQTFEQIVGYETVYETIVTEVPVYEEPTYTYEEPAYVEPVVESAPVVSYGGFTSAAGLGQYGANTYPILQCTWGVKELAPWAHNYWGNGAQWSASAQAAGFTVGYTPQVGSIMVFNDGGYGHVAYVIAVDDASGNIQVMEANFGGSAYAADPRGIGNYRGWFNPNTTGSAISYIYPPADYAG